MVTTEARYNPNEWITRPGEVENFEVLFTHPKNGCVHSGESKSAYLRGLNAQDVLGAIATQPNRYPIPPCDDCTGYYSEVSVI